MTQSYWRTWLSLTLSLDDSGLISSSDRSHEAACKVLEHTKSHEELRDPNSDLFTGTFIKKRVEDFPFDSQDAELFESMGIGDLRQLEIVLHRPEWLSKFDRIQITGPPPEEFGTGTRIEAPTSDIDEFDDDSVTIWYVSDKGVDDEGVEYLRFHYSHSLEEGQEQRRETQIGSLEQWLIKTLNHQTGLSSLANFGTLWRRENPDFPPVKELTQQSGFKNLKHYIEESIEPKFKGDLVWTNKENERIGLGLKGNLDEAIDTEEQQLEIVKLWLSSSRKIPKDPQVAAGIYHLVNLYLSGGLPWEESKLYQEHGELRRFVQDNFDLVHHTEPSNADLSFAWMINKAATSGRNGNGIPTVYEMLASTTRLLRNFKLNNILQPPKADREIVRRIVDDWEAGVKEALPLVSEETSARIANYWKNEEEQQEHRSTQAQVHQHEIAWAEEQLRRGLTLTNVPQSYQSSVAEMTSDKIRDARLAEEKRSHAESEKSFFKEYGPIDSPRRVADLLNALEDNPSDLSEFTHQVKMSYKFSTGSPWSRLDGRNKMVHYVWTFREAFPLHPSTEVISTALVAAGKTSKEAKAILDEASNFR